MNPKKYAQIFQTQKNTRLNLQPKKIQELKILDPKKYVGPPRHVYTQVPKILGGWVTDYENGKERTMNQEEIPFINVLCEMA